VAGGFTDEQRKEINLKLINAGCDISTKVGLKKMTVAMITKEAGVAVGSFYNFYASKEEFVVAMIRDTELRLEVNMAKQFDKDGTITLKKFLSVFREGFRPENNLLLRMKLDDWVWMKSHISDSSYFDTSSDMKKFEFLTQRITDVRKDADPGVVVNFIKSIYALYQNRDTLFEKSLQTNVDLIFDSLFRYLKV